MTSSASSPSWSEARPIGRKVTSSSPRGVAARTGRGRCLPQAAPRSSATAELHIGVDTGTTHLAAAAGTPVVALYSHRAPIMQWAPIGRGHRIVDHPVPCAGCAAVVCPVAEHPCMAEITVDQVWAQVEAARARVTTHG